MNNNKILLAEYKKTNSLRIKDQIVRENTGLVIEIIKRKFDYPEKFEDLRQEGFIALSNAIEKFDLNKKLEFSTFAYKVVRNRLINYLRDNKTPVWEEMTEFESRPQPISADSFLEMSNLCFSDYKNRFFEAVLNKKDMSKKERRAFERMKVRMKKDLK